MVEVRPQHHGIERVSRVLAKQRVIQLCGAVLVAEQQPQRVLVALTWTPAPTAVNPHAGVDFEFCLAVGADQFDRYRAFPRDSFPQGVRIDACIFRPKVFRVENQRHHGNGLEIIAYRVAVSRVVHDLRVHIIVGPSRISRRRIVASTSHLAPRTRLSVSVLTEHLVEVDVDVGRDLAGNEVRSNGGGSQDSQAGDLDRTRVDRSIVFGWLAAVRGVVDRSAGRIVGQLDLKRFIVEPTIHGDRDVPNKSFENLIRGYVGLAGCRGRHESGPGRLAECRLHVARDESQFGD